MAKKSTSPLHIAPLQKVVAEPITDPAERAILDEQRNCFHQGSQPVRSRGAVRERGAVQGKGATRASRLPELFRQLPVEEGNRLLSQATAQLSGEDQLELRMQLLADLPAEVQQRFEDELLIRLGA